MRTLLAFIVAMLSGALHAGAVTLPNTDVVYLASKANGIEYKVYVSYPRDLAASKDAYPLIVSLDADYSFAIIRNITEHLADRHDIPPMIVASIGYAGETTMSTYRTHRSRDYTPVFDPDDGYGEAFQERSGGAPAFLAFIRGELLPMLAQRYRARGARALVGHSYGGLFSSYVMLEEPELFDGYIIVSPSLWYHDGWIFALEAEKARTRKRMDAAVYLSVGDFEGGSMVVDLERMATRLGSRHYAGLELRADVLSDETHNSVFPRAVSNGVRMIWPRATGREWQAQHAASE